MRSLRSGAGCKEKEKEKKLSQDAMVKNILPRYNFQDPLPPRCLNFASSKDEFADLYPGYMFCSNCSDVIHDFLGAPNGQRGIGSRRYKCTGGHTDHSFPTTLSQKPWWSSRLLRGNYKDSTTNKFSQKSPPPLAAAAPPPPQAASGITPGQSSSPPTTQVLMDATEYEFLKQLLVEFEDVKDTLATSTTINIQLEEQNKLLSEKALTSDGKLLETKKQNQQLRLQ